MNDTERLMREKFGDFNVDTDMMRDVYMTDSQRAAYNRILSRALQAQPAEGGVDKLPAKFHEEWIPLAKGGTFYAVPMESLSRNDLLAALMQITTEAMVRECKRRKYAGIDAIPGTIRSDR